MSYTAIIPFVGGKPQPSVKFHNAWGGVARIWDSLFKAYIPKKHEFDSWLHDNTDRLWALAKRPDLPVFERAVHAFTFDLFYVRNEHFSWLANDLRLFVEKYPVAGQVDHLLAWAKWLDENDVEAVGLIGTSVSGNLWSRQKKCPHCAHVTDDMEDVPLSEGTEVYDWLDNPKS